MSNVYRFRVVIWDERSEDGRPSILDVQETDATPKNLPGLVKALDQLIPQGRPTEDEVNEVVHLYGWHGRDETLKVTLGRGIPKGCRVPQVTVNGQRALAGLTALMN